MRACCRRGEPRGRADRRTSRGASRGASRRGSEDTSSARGASLRAPRYGKQGRAGIDCRPGATGGVIRARAYGSELERASCRAVSRAEHGQGDSPRLNTPRDLPLEPRDVASRRLRPAGSPGSGLVAIAFLAGLRFPWESIKHWFRGVAAMRESSVYEGLLQEGRAEGRVEGRAEGRAEGARRILLRQGELRFGLPDMASRAALESIADLERLEGLSERVLTVASWTELLGEP